jgi:RNA polymerase sigma-70 factor (sigma-E family)
LHFRSGEPVRIGRRERDDFIRFASESASRLLRVAELLLRDRFVAEDAVQTTLLRVFQHWDRAKENPQAYSRTVLLNVCRDQWRRDAFRPRTELSDALEREPERSRSLLEIFEDRAYLDGLLRDLTEQQRAILVLRFYLDLSVAETAELLGLPEGTIKSYTSRALATVRRSLPEQRKERPECSPTNS